MVRSQQGYVRGMFCSHYKFYFIAEWKPFVWTDLDAPLPVTVDIDLEPYANVILGLLVGSHFWNWYLDNVGVFVAKVVKIKQKKTELIFRIFTVFVISNEVFVSSYLRQPIKNVNGFIIQIMKRMTSCAFFFKTYKIQGKPKLLSKWQDQVNWWCWEVLNAIIN